MQRLGGQGMRIHISYRRVTSLYAVFAIVMCCILLALSGCGNPVKGSIVPSTQKTPRSSPTSLPLHSRIGAPEVTTESILRAQLARVQQIMAGMSLDQKLGQLIMLEYLGNSYEGSGLQYMITQQFVGGFMYQESNHNFDAPYDVASSVDALSVQAMSDAAIPLLIATDQEGGLVNRLYKFHGYLPSAAEMTASGDPHMALAQGTQAAKWMLELGINSDLAPVVDVHSVDPPILE